MTPTYGYYKNAFQGYPMPFAFVDVDLFDQNVQAILGRANGKNICIASKSLRCVSLIKRILAASPSFHSIMSYSTREAVFLAEQGLDNILIAYPVLGEAGVSNVCETLKAGKRITLMVDCQEHVDLLEQLGAENSVTIPICMDIDMSGRYPGIFFGVRRSSITTPEQALELWETIRRCPHVRLDGIMGYEAQIASLPDQPPRQVVRNIFVRALKRRSRREVITRRAEVVNALRKAGAELRFVNGGGTGSMESTIKEDVVTEVTVGSGFYSPTLFDHFARFKHHPAAAYAIEIVRRPTVNIYTCQGGGYVASGAAGPDKLPSPYLPEGARLIDQEGAGEVQTPIVYDGPETLSLGDPIFMRHAKAGELCERFNSLLLLSNGRVVEETLTYRGQEKCFL